MQCAAQGSSSRSTCYVCNAGLRPFGDFLTAKEDGLRSTVLVNAMAPLVLMRRLLPGMIERARASNTRSGLIVVSEFPPVPRLAVYAASKAFDLSLTEEVDAEVTGDPIDGPIPWAFAESLLADLSWPTISETLASLTTHISPSVFMKAFHSTEASSRT